MLKNLSNPTLGVTIRVVAKSLDTAVRNCTNIRRSRPTAAKCPVREGGLSLVLPRFQSPDDFATALGLPYLNVDKGHPKDIIHPACEIENKPGDL
jgi:hypothetical protein